MFSEEQAYRSGSARRVLRRRFKISHQIGREYSVDVPWEKEGPRGGICRENMQIIICIGAREIYFLFGKVSIRDIVIVNQVAYAHVLRAETRCVKRLEVSTKGRKLATPASSRLAQLEPGNLASSGRSMLAHGGRDFPRFSAVSDRRQNLGTGLLWRRLWSGAASSSLIHV